MSAVMENKQFPPTQRVKAVLYDSIIDHSRWQLEFYKERQDGAVAKAQATPVSEAMHMEWHRQVLEYSGLYHAYYTILLRFGDLEKPCDCYVCTLPPTKGESA